jgi:hypothetical protein
MLSATPRLQAGSRPKVASFGRQPTMGLVQGFQPSSTSGAKACGSVGKKGAAPLGQVSRGESE